MATSEESLFTRWSISCDVCEMGCVFCVLHAVLFFSGPVLAIQLVFSAAKLHLHFDRKRDHSIPIFRILARNV